MLRRRPPKPYKLLKFFRISVILLKMSKLTLFSSQLLSNGSWITEFYICHKTDKKNFKSLYGFGGRFLDIRDVCMDFEPCFKVYNLVPVHPKSMKLGQMANLNVIFHEVVSVYRLVKIWNSPQFPVEFRNGLLWHAC